VQLLVLGDDAVDDRAQDVGHQPLVEGVLGGEAPDLGVDLGFPERVLGRQATLGLDVADPPGDPEPLGEELDEALVDGVDLAAEHLELVFHRPIVTHAAGPVRPVTDLALELTQIVVKVPGARAEHLGQKDYAVTISPFPLIDVTDVEPTWPDDVIDLTDRRRLLVFAVLGVDLPGALADQVFRAEGDQSSSTTMRSAGRVPSTDDT
jgi:hypothetical protein